MSKKKIIRKIVAYFILTIVAVFFLFPIYWMLMQSLKSNADAVSQPPKIIFDPMFSNYIRVLTEGGLIKNFINSFTIGIVSVLIAIIFGAPAAYAFARFKHRGKEQIAFFILSTKFLPFVVVVIPFVRIFSALKLNDTLIAVIISHLLIHIALVVWMLRAFIEKIPPSIEEAALVDGCNRIGALRRVVIPQIIPGLVATGVLSFIFSWNELMFGYVLTGSDARPLSVRFATEFIGYIQIDWAGLSAAGIIAIVIPIIMIISIERSLVRGFTFGVLDEK